MQPYAPLPPRESAVDACFERLRDAILSGDLPAGARLPPERTLAERFGVNRATLRGALTRLSAAQLLNVRQGSGYVVQPFAREGGPELLIPLGTLAVGRGDLPHVAADLLRVRRHLALAVLERLSDGIAPAGLTAYLAAVDAFAAVLDQPPAAVAEADLAVASALVAATESPVLAVCMNPLLAVVRHLEPLRDALYRCPEQNLAGWRLLGAWLAHPDRAVLEPLRAELERRDHATLAYLGAAP